MSKTRHQVPPTPDDALADLHFAFREIVREPDAVLATRGLSRMHHRVLYMCRRNEGLTVNALCDVLEISKQALHRPLLDLARSGLVTKSRDAVDARRRVVVLTAAGRALERRLSEPQRAAFARAFKRVGDAGAARWAEVMHELAGGKSESSAQLKHSRTEGSA